MKIEVAIDLGVVALGELEELVITDVGAGQNARVDSELIGVLRLPPGLKEQRLFPVDVIGVEAGKARPLAEVAGVCQAQPQTRLGKERGIVIAHAADYIETVR